MKENQKKHEVLATKSYDMFVIPACNKDYEKTNLQRIENSVLRKNMLHLCPIIVNNRMEVIDGKHRLMVAKKLDLPIFYFVSGGTETDDIIELNANKRTWKIDNYINYWCGKENDSYLFIRDVSNKFKLSHSTSLELCSFFCEGPKSNGSDTTNKFRNGKFAVMENKRHEVIEFLMFYEELSALVKTITTKRTNWLRTKSFLVGLRKFLLEKNPDRQVLLSKCKLQPVSLRPCATVADYAEMLSVIYNYKNRHAVK